MKRFVGVFALLLLPWSASWSASVGLFSSPDFASCNLSVPPIGVGTFYVVAVDADTPICCGPGLGAMAFGISGLPAGWSTTVTPSPQANIALGNLFIEGAQIAFPSPQHGSYIPLYTITVVPNPIGASATLTVQASSIHLPWSDIYCPFRIGAADCPCDPDAACVDGSILHINEPGECVTAVQPISWSSVKLLFD